MKRDLINWITIIKQAPNQSNPKHSSILQSDIKILNLITCELRETDQRKEVLTNRMIDKYKDGANNRKEN